MEGNSIVIAEVLGFNRLRYHIECIKLERLSANLSTALHRPQLAFFQPLREKLYVLSLGRTLLTFEVITGRRRRTPRSKAGHASLPGEHNRQHINEPCGPTKKKRDGPKKSKTVLFTALKVHSCWFADWIDKLLSGVLGLHRPLFARCHHQISCWWLRIATTMHEVPLFRGSQQRGRGWTPLFWWWRRCLASFALSF